MLSCTQQPAASSEHHVVSTYAAPYYSLPTAYSQLLTNTHFLLLTTSYPRLLLVRALGQLLLERLGLRRHERVHDVIARAPSRHRGHPALSARRGRAWRTRRGDGKNPARSGVCLSKFNPGVSG